MRRQSLATVLLLLVAAAALAAPAAGHFESSCPFYDHGGHGEPHERHDHGHSCGGGADHEHHHHHHHGHGHGEIQRLLPEEMAEEADLELESFGYEDHDHGHHHHHHHHHSHGDMETSPMGVWLSAMGCSLLVSMASLVCLVLLPVIFFKGKPSKAIVDSLAVFGAGAMLGDSFLHQLPHAFGGGHSHSHDHEGHDHAHAHEHAHAHSLQDLSVGLSVLFGIVLFFIVEKIVRYVEDNSQNGAHSMGHGHHHHNHKRHDSSDKAKLNYQKSDTDGKDIDHAEEEPSVNDTTGKISDGHESEATIRKRSSSKATDGEATNSGRDPAPEKAPSISNSNLVFGYLNLFSDGVHNFTDGMALGSAFLLHGSVGGWSRTLFLLAHELPQEEILVSLCGQASRYLRPYSSISSLRWLLLLEQH
uniref:IAA-alanine resistance protein 1 n=1 Tax=Zea mays TaxID=4577 RepID=A0A804LUM9_MAIZE